MMNWGSTILDVICLPPHKDLQIKKEAICHPLKDGFVISIGELRGQISDYRKRLSDGRGIHIREYPTHYMVHWDLVDPSDPLGHLLCDAQHWLFIIGIAAIGFVCLLSELD